MFTLMDAITTLGGVNPAAAPTWLLHCIECVSVALTAFLYVFLIWLSYTVCRSFLRGLR